MRVGIVGTGAIASKHAQAYRNIGYEITVCTNATAVTGQKFSEATGAEFVPTVVCHGWMIWTQRSLIDRQRPTE